MPNTEPDDYLKVIVGVIEDGDANILLARRPLHLHQGGKWEFPGGKIEPGEEPIAALRRELQEELALTITRAMPLIQVPFQYASISVLLDVWKVQSYSGVAIGREGQEIRWVQKDELSSVEFPAANHAIVAAINLAPVYAISAVGKYGEKRFFQILDKALNSGLELLQLREHHLEKKAYLKLANKIVEKCHRHNVKVILNCDPEWLVETAADGVHLTQQRLMTTKHRPLSNKFIVAASCHDQASLQHAALVESDFVTLSPVNETASHPGANPVGWREFQKLCATTALPVFALGGMALSGVAYARQQGAQGVALVSGLWEADDQELAAFFK